MGSGYVRRLCVCAFVLSHHTLYFLYYVRSVRILCVCAYLDVEVLSISISLLHAHVTCSLDFHDDEEERLCVVGTVHPDDGKRRGGT